MITSPWNRPGSQLPGNCFTRLFALLPRSGRRLSCLAVGVFVLIGPLDAPNDRLRAAPVPKKKEEKFVVQFLPRGSPVPSDTQYTSTYLLRLQSNGTFRDIDFGKMTYEDLRSSWSKATEDEYLELIVEDEERTSIQLLGNTLTRLREASNPKVKTTVYVRLKSWVREKPASK